MNESCLISQFSLKIEDDDEKFDSIINTGRYFDEINLLNLTTTESHVTKKMNEILDKFGSDIKVMSIHNSTLPESHLIEMLNHLENLEKLDFYDVTYNSTEKDDIKLNLPQIKSFEMQLCNLIIPRTLFRIPPNTLECLSIHNCVLDKRSISQILDSQKNLKVIEFDPYCVDANLMAPLQLKKLTLLSKRNAISIIKTQPHLKYLNLTRALIGDDEFLDICKMRHLESLELWVDIISYEILDNLMNLRNLKELSVSYDRLVVEYMTKLSTIFLPNITKLKIEFPKLKIHPEHFIAISVNCPNIQHLVIKCQSIGVIGTILQYFRNIKTLSFDCDSDSVKVVNFPFNHIVNENLLELYIHDAPYNNPSKDQFQSSLTLMGLIKNSLPNLEKLKIENVLSLNTQFFEEILGGNNELTHIHVDDISDNFHFDENFCKNILRTHGRKLTYLKLSKVVVKIDEEKVKHLLGSYRFAYVNCKEWRNEVTLRNCKWIVNDN